MNNRELKASYTELLLLRIAVLNAMLLILSGCGSEESKWAQSTADRCRAMGGTYTYSNHTIECYRHPIGRMTKLLFKETFK